MPPKGRDFNYLAAHPDMHDLEPSSDNSRASEKGHDLLGSRVGGYIKIFGPLTQQ